MRRSLGLMLATAAALLCTAAAALAQDVQVPMDAGGRIVRVDARLARRLGLFEREHPGFQEARLYRSPDSTFTLEVVAGARDHATRTRIPLTGAQADSLRQVVSERIAIAAPHAGLQQEGRPLLLAGSTLLGLGFYGWAVPVATDMQGGEAVIGTYMLTAAGSFFLPMMATQGTDVTYPMANLALHGATRGIYHGVLLADGFSGGRAGGQGVVATALLASVVEGVAGYAWAQSSHMDNGAAATIAMGGDVGLLYGLGVAQLSNQFENDEHAAAAATALTVNAAGLVAGHWLARHRAFTYGDAGVMRAAGLVGGYLGFAIADASGSESSKAKTAAAMAGGALGLVAGDRMVRRTDFSAGQMVLVELGTVAGGLFGLGVGFLSDVNHSSEGRVLVVTSAFGAALGFAASYAALRGDVRAGNGASSLRLGLTPGRRLADLTGRASPVPLFLTLHHPFD